jgi:sodium/bile acid cotransporter 7
MASGLLEAGLLPSAHVQFASKVEVMDQRLQRQPSRAQSWRVWSYVNFLPIALIGAIALGITFPGAAQALDGVKIGKQKVVQDIAVIYIFLFQGMNFKIDEIKKAYSAWVSILCTLFFILFISPLSGYLVHPLSFLTPDLRTGLMLFLIMPCWMNSGCAMVAAANGSVPVGLLITVTANAIALLTIPMWLELFLESSSNIEFDPVDMWKGLTLTVLVPGIVGFLVRTYSGKVARFHATHKEKMTILAHTCLSTIPFMKVGTSYDHIMTVEPFEITAIIITFLVVHCCMLGGMYAATAPFPERIPIPVRKAIVIMASGKTLPVAMAVLTFLPHSIGDKGLIAVPCIVCHLSQVLLDAFVATHWAEATAVETCDGLEFATFTESVTSTTVSGGSSATVPAMLEPAWLDTVDYNTDSTDDTDDQRPRSLSK